MRKFITMLNAMEREDMRIKQRRQIEEIIDAGLVRVVAGDDRAIEGIDLCLVRLARLYGLTADEIFAYFQKRLDAQ